jgi:hypothetical protein
VKPRRRIRKRFVLTVLLATVIVGMLASTAWTWTWRLAGSAPTVYWRVDDRWLRCDGTCLYATWVVIDPGKPPLISSLIDASTLNTGRRGESKSFIYCNLSALDANFRVLQSSAGFERVRPEGCGCRLWLVRSVLGGLLPVSLWAAWRTRPRERLGSCERCGYDRTGLAAAAKCPECGAAAGASPPAP